MNIFTENEEMKYVNLMVKQLHLSTDVEMLVRHRLYY
jgi:hypothetical protein